MPTSPFRKGDKVVWNRRDGTTWVVTLSEDPDEDCQASCYLEDTSDRCTAHFLNQTDPENSYLSPEMEFEDDAGYWTYFDGSEITKIDSGIDGDW